jgi:hypothetical protein
MKKCFHYLTVLMFIVSCSNQNSTRLPDSKTTRIGDTIITNQNSNPNPSGKSDSSVTSTGNAKVVNQKKILPAFIDNTFFPFADSSYILSLHIFRPGDYDEEKKNSIISFNQINGNTVHQIFRDSFYCMDQLVDTQDFNNDHVKDVLIFHYSGGRANPTYHLFLKDTVNKKLTYVKGFEELPNPDLDSVNNIIVSTALAGSDLIVKLFRINVHNKLIDLGHGFTSDLEDSVKYDRAVRKILKERGK